MARAKSPPKRPSRRRPAEPPESARERVLRAALEVFAERGFEATGTTEVARRAGVTQPLVHYHFASKAALWEAAVAHLFGRLTALTDGAAADLVDLDPIARLKVMLRRYVRFSAAHPEVARFFLREGAQPGPRLAWLVATHARPLHDALEALLGDAQTKGLLKPLSLDVLQCLIIVAGSHPFTVPALALAEHNLDVRDPAVIERYADVVVEALFHGIALAHRRPAEEVLP
ncbi:MAG: helix-turn-helix domain-containing protein [Polyangiales bacterium]